MSVDADQFSLILDEEMAVALRPVGVVGAVVSAAACVVALAPRLFASLLGTDLSFPVGQQVWRESSLVLPEGEYTDVLTGRDLRGGSQRVADLLAEFPVALLSTA